MDDSDELVCIRCRRPVTVNRELYHEVLERMHKLCFHLEYEHDADPDESCGLPFCPWWQMEALKDKLMVLGYDPEDVLDEAIDDHLLGR